MNKLTIKSGCVEAQFKRGREQTKSLERATANALEQPVAVEASARPTINAEIEVENPPNAETIRKTT